MWFTQLFPFCGTAFRGKSDSKTLRKMAQYENDRMWQDVFVRNSNLIASLIEWEGLPETVDPMWFELQNLFFGQTCILYDTDFSSYINPMCTPAGKMNMYYQNSIYRGYSIGYSKRFLALTSYNKTILSEITYPNGENNLDNVYLKGVVCNDNPLCYPLIETLEMYTTRIVRAMRAIDVVQNQAKLSSLIETDEDTKLAIQTAINDIDNNVLAVYASNKITKAIMESKSIPTQFQPPVLDVLWNHKNNLEAEMLTAFGMNNLNTADKKERLITDEVNSNNQRIAMNLQYRLKSREIFARNLKSVFGIDAKPSVSEVMTQNVGPQSVGEKNGDYIKDTE